MDVANLFGDALKYPTQDFNKVLILGLLSVIGVIPIFILAILPLIFPTVGVIGASLTLIVIVTILLGALLSLIYSGYGLNIIKNTLALDSRPPEFDWGLILIDGLKVWVLGIIYSLIPAILYGVFFLLMMGSFTAANSANVGAIMIGNFIFLAILGIVSVIFELLYIVAIGKFAETDDLGAAANMIDVFHKIGEIGWGNFILWLIVIWIIFMVISVVVGILAFTVIGILIVGLLGLPYIMMFTFRALGLLYNESRTTTY